MTMAKVNNEEKFLNLVGTHIGVSQATFDSFSWVLAIICATFARFDFKLNSISWVGVSILIPIIILAQIDAGILVGLYSGRWRFGSFEEVGALIRTVIIAGIIVFISDALLLPGRAVPLGSVLIGAALAFLFMCFGRWWWRARIERVNSFGGSRPNKLVIFGAGEAGYQALSAIRRDPDCGLEPVALLDDDPLRRNLKVFGVGVAGKSTDLEKIVKKYGANTLLIAAPSAPIEVVNLLIDIANKIHLTIKTVPNASRLFGDAIDSSDIQEIQAEDLLGRESVQIDDKQIGEFLLGKRVLITGAGGSIGSELARQVSRYGPSELTLLDRDESALLGVQLSMEGRALLDSPSLVLADIRDFERLIQVFQDRKPEIVFHAAALKHLTLLERFPLEAWKSNVIGTLNVLEASKQAKVMNFVNISTDKAADAKSVLGLSKRIAERLCASVAANSVELGEEATYVSVRFANVLGSRGSVLEVFRHQAESGNPLTVTDPEVTRFVMTISEAVRLVTQAAAIGRNGEVLILDMGTPVKILEIAKHFANRRNPPLDVIFTGLRPGEKLHEVLFGDGEPDERPFHKKVSHVNVPPLDWSSAESTFGKEKLEEISKILDDKERAIKIRQIMTNICALPSTNGVGDSQSKDVGSTYFADKDENVRIADSDLTKVE